MYLHEVENARNEGKKVRRASWSKQNRLVKVKKAKVSLTPEDQAEAGLDGGFEATAENVNVLCIGRKKAIVGYELTHEDKTSQDWEILD